MASQASAVPADTSNPPGWRWSSRQTLFFLDLLREAKRNGQLESNKIAITRLRLETFLAMLQAEFPEDVWAIGVLENKLRWLREYWRAFRDVLERSGTSYNEQTGMVSTSRDNEVKFIERFPRFGKRIIREGLLVNGDITLDSYYEIFSNDPPAGRYIIEADDVSGFSQLRQPPPADSNDAEDTISIGGGNEDEPAETIESPPPTLSTDSPMPTGSTLSAVETPSREGSKRPNTPGIPANTGASFSNKRRKVKKGEGGLKLEDVKDLLLATNGLARSHTIAARPIGSEDLERAIADCWDTLVDWEMPSVLRVVKWISEDPIHAVTWLALGTKERKIAWSYSLDDGF